jgi:hypothetical protein
MDHEVSKHLKKIYAIAQRTKKSVGEKVVEILIEIFIIIFAITLSIKLHSWSEHRVEQKETKEFLIDLKLDLQKDIERVTSGKTNLMNNIQPYVRMKSFNKQQIDSLDRNDIEISLPMILIIRKTNSGNYEGFKSSGKIGLIENKKLKKAILDYYQDTMPSISSIEDISNNQFTHLLDLIRESSSKKGIFKASVMDQMQISILLAKSLISNYDEVLKDANDIINEIDAETKEES